MIKQEAYRKYRKIIPPEIFKDYKDPDQYLYLNIDKDLQKIRIPLPPCPDWSKIDGWGLKAEDQVFTYESYPPRLTQLEQNIRKKYEELFNLGRLTLNQREKLIHKEFYETLRLYKKDYQEEIEWIRRQWAYRLYGKWVFINGKPTYICGWHWFYLNYWTLEGVGKPEYYHSDMLWFNAVWYAYNCTEIPVRVFNKESGKYEYEYNEDGTIKMKDVGYRTLYGVNILKPRRVGDSSKASCVNYCIISTSLQTRGGIQGNKESTAEQIFKDKMLVGISNIPLFFKPFMKNYDPKSSIEFDGDPPGTGLQSRIDYATTAKKNYYDNAKLKVYQAEEPGKTVGESILRRHNVIKECCSIHTKIEGFMIYCTTTYDEDTNETESVEFRRLCEESHFENRNENGQTISGLINIFIPADMRMHGFIGKYGEPIANTPTRQQLKHMKNVFYNAKGEPIGAREYILNQRKEAEMNGRYDTLSDLKRAYPLCWRDCFTTPSFNLIFNIKTIEERIQFLEFEGRNLTRRGNLVWHGGITDTYVEWIDDEYNGKFIASKMPEGFGIKRTIEPYYDTYVPLFGHKFIASADPFKVEGRDNYRMSRGGGAVRWMYDPEVDGGKASKYDYESQSLIMTYEYKPNTLEEYLEDMLMMTIFWGAYMYPEENIQVVSKYFIERGYKGLLLYETDPITGKTKDYPGWITDRVNKAQLFNLIKNDLEYHAHKCNHIEYLKDCLKIKNPEDMRHFDRFTAVAGTIRGEYILQTFNQEHMKPVKKDIGDLYAAFTNRINLNILDF